MEPTSLSGLFKMTAGILTGLFVFYIAKRYDWL